MYLINTTFTVDTAVHGSWLDMMRHKFMPFLRDAGFDVVALSRVLSEKADTHFTYSLLIRAEEFSGYGKFTETILPEYDAIAGEIFSGYIYQFTSIMKTTEI